jgi:transposase-like protein
MNSPKTLQQAIVYFSDVDRAFQYALNLRWPKGIVTCPRCDGDNHSFIKTRKIWYCNPCKKQFTLKVGTIFEDSPIGLDKWMTAFWMLANCKNGVSSYEMARTIGVTQKSAWFMLQRIREVMKTQKGSKIGGSPKNQVEIDETYVGGKAQNMHTKRRIAYQNGDKKAVVMGMRTRNTREVRAMVVPNAKRETLQNKILEHVGWGAHIYTDQHVGYEGVDATHLFVHKTVNHMQEYVRGEVHTQGIENFWSLLKRTLKGTYVAVEPFHLDRYLAEQVFRFNNCGRKMNDTLRFEKAMGNVAGHRLTYNTLTGTGSATSHSDEAGTW